MFKFTEDVESVSLSSHEAPYKLIFLTQMLCRLVDDYLFVTADIGKARKFLNMMTTGMSPSALLLSTSNASTNDALGHPEYGCFISIDKTLINFEDNTHVMSQIFPGQNGWPISYYIATSLTALSKNSLGAACLLTCSICLSRPIIPVTEEDVSESLGAIITSGYFNPDIGDTLTIERGRRPGAAFEHKMLQCVQLLCHHKPWSHAFPHRMARSRSHAIFCDTSLNSNRAVHRNVYQNFVLAAMKMYCYVRGWGVDLEKKGVRKFIIGRFFASSFHIVGHSHVIDVIHKTIRFTYKAVRSRAVGRVGRAHGATCTINELAVIW